MLGTLLKHEWKDTWLLCTVCNAVSLLLSVIGALIIVTSDFAKSKDLTDGQKTLMTAGISGYIVIYVFSVMAVVIVMRYYFFIRYYKHLFTDQGYLMHTLPVKSTDLINSKLFIAVIWQYITGFITTISIIILIAALIGTLGKISASEITDAFSSLEMEWEELFKNIPLVIAGICTILVTPVLELLVMYMAIGIGQMSKKNRLFLSILVLIGINVVKRYSLSFISMPFQFLIIDKDVPKLEMVNALSLVFVVVLIAVGVGLYFLDKYFIEKKLNLE